MSDKAPDNTEHYEGLGAAGLKGSTDTGKAQPSESEDKRGGQSKD